MIEYILGLPSLVASGVKMFADASNSFVTAMPHGIPLLLIVVLSGLVLALRWKNHELREKLRSLQ